MLAALLPCFWVYREVGRHIHARAARPNPYQPWIDTYAGEEFEKAVDAVIGLTDSVAEQASESRLAAMHHAFRRAIQLEWMFWESALGDPVIGRIESLQVEARRNKTRLNKGKWLGQWSTKHLHC
jgi:thiaminase/transcriptional activator TenA